MPTGVYIRTEKHNKAISDSLKGKKPINFEDMQKLGWEKNKGRRPVNWKGDNVGYYALHSWVQKYKEKLSKCVECGTIKAKRYEWANISGKYKRDLNDYRSLCVSCHRKEGYMKGEYTAWAKGKHITFNTGRTWIKKGQHLSPETEFKKTVELKET